MAIKSLRKILIPLFISMVFFTINAQTNEKTIKAVKGDGIYKLLQRNGLDPAKYLNSFIELNKSNLGNNNSLFAGRDYILPSSDNINTESAESVTSVDYPIFGSKYSKVEIIDNQLKGTVYYLVAGHGGPDPGALGKYGNYTLPEDEYAYDVTLRLARSLISHGALVYLIVR
ncbi:N-acetylmuramoyl-L-alanine amidase, partial [Bacteroidota bacterium]